MLLVTLIVTQREIFNMATWRPIKRFTCLIVSVVHSCIHGRLYVSLLFEPRVDAQETFKIIVFRTDSQTTGGINWFVVIVKIINFIDARIVFFSVHVDFFFFSVSWCKAWKREILRVWESWKFVKLLEDTSWWRVYARGSEGFLVTDLTSSNCKIKMSANSQKTGFTHRLTIDLLSSNLSLRTPLY